MRILAWHFLPEDRRLTHGDRREVKVGETLRHEGSFKICESGLHASPKIMDAFSFRRGTTVCRVALTGDVQRQSDKIAASERTVIWMHDATKAFQWFAADCAERALATRANPDPRSTAAVQACRDYLMGKISLEAMRNAANAANAAAAAYAAASAYAAYAAANAAAAAAAADAAAYADAAAAADAAYAASSYAEREWQSKRLRQLIALDRRGLAPWT